MDLNIVVVGAPGSGKTSLLEFLTMFLPPDSAVITFEDVSEIRVMQENVFPLLLQGQKDPSSLPDALRAWERAKGIKPRVIMGELTMQNALGALAGMNVRAGWLSTSVAGSAGELIARLEEVTVPAGFRMPPGGIRAFIASAIDLMVVLERGEDDSRRVIAVTEVNGLSEGVVDLCDVFARHQGRLQATGRIPAILARFRSHGIILPPELFTP